MLKPQHIFCLMLVFSVALIPATSQATRILFDDVSPGLPVYFVDVDGDAFGDVIFNCMDGGGFEQGYAPSPTLIEGPGLKGSSLSETDLEIFFTHGATDYLQFDFALTTHQDEPGGYAYLWLYNATGDPIGSSHTVYVQPTGDLQRHEATVSIDLDEAIAFAKINFVTQGGGSWFVIDNFEGNFVPENPDTTPHISISPEPASFGKIPLKTSSSPVQVTVSNDGIADCTLGAVTISGPDASQFSISNDQSSNKVLAPSETATLDVLFQPLSLGEKKAKLVIAMDDPQSQGYDLTLKGVGCPRIELINPNPASPDKTVVVIGEGFEDLRWVKVGGRQFKKKSDKVEFWAADYVIFKLPTYSNWENNVTEEKKVTIAVKHEDEILKSNTYGLIIHKP